MDEKPQLTDLGVKVFLSQTLKKCHSYRENYYNIVINLIILFSFFTIVALILMYKYKGKLSPEEKAEIEKQKEQYIMSKIKNYQQDKLYAQQKLITGLPHWETEYDIIHKKNHL